jgi:hypothetical protein
MAPTLTFGTLRFIVVSLAVFAQIYLFLRIRHAIRSSERSARFKSLAVVLAGALIVLLFALNVLILLKPIPWVDPPAAAQALLFYLPAVWGIGSILSALLLVCSQAAGFLGQTIIGRCRNPARPAEGPPADPERRRLLQAGVGRLPQRPLSFPATAPPGPEGPMRCGHSRCLSACR